MDLANPEAEVMTLVGVLTTPSAFWSINSVGLKVEDFHSPSNRILWQAISAVANERLDPEFPRIIEELHLAGHPTEYAEKLYARRVPPGTASEYAKVVKGLGTARRLATAGARIIEIASENRSDAEVAVSAAESELRQVRDLLPRESRSPVPSDIILRIRHAETGRRVKLDFSPRLDWLTGGFIPGMLWVVGGFSSTGKTAVAVNMLDSCINHNAPAAVISTEMTQEQYVIRMLSLRSGVPNRFIRDHAIVGIEQNEALAKAEDELSRSSLRFFDTVSTIGGIALQARKLKETTGLDVLFVDFLQNVLGSQGDEVKDAREVVITLQNLAKELDMTVVAFSQLSNEMAKYQQDGGNANYYSFKGSGAIRDAADIGIMLQRDRVRRSPVLDFKVVKNRHGEIEVITTNIHLDTGRIREVTDGE